MRFERLRKSLIGIGSAVVDQKEIDGDDLRLQLRDRIDDLCKIDPEKRVSAPLLHHVIVNCHNGHEIRGHPFAAGQRPDIDRCGFDAIEKSQAAPAMLEINPEPPDRCLSDGNRSQDMAADHQYSLAETSQQSGHTSGSPALHRQRSARFHIHSLARPQGYAATARPPSNADPPVDDKDGGFVASDIDGPLRAADRRDRLWCNDLKFVSAWL